MAKKINFKAISDYVIHNSVAVLEGGYYHPDMLVDGRMSPTDSNKKAMIGSGETMFGIDRGDKTVTINTAVKAKLVPRLGSEQDAVTLSFWAIIDKAQEKVKWQHKYMGGTHEDELRKIAAQIIRKEFNRLVNAKIPSESGKKIINTDLRQAFHFIYATWNGAGWFSRFAASFNNAISRGVTDSDELAKISVKTRAESGDATIIKSAENFVKIFNSRFKGLIK